MRDGTIWINGAEDAETYDADYQGIQKRHVSREQKYEEQKETPRVTVVPDTVTFISHYQRVNP